MNNLPHMWEDMQSQMHLQFLTNADYYCGGGPQDNAANMSAVELDHCNAWDY